jgi:hypothetical protein
MRARRKHAAEVETDVGLVRRLLTGQFPQWAGLPIRPVESYGTDRERAGSGFSRMSTRGARGSSRANGGGDSGPSTKSR